MNNNKTTQIEIDGLKYQVDLAKAIEQGLIKPVKYYKIGQKFLFKFKHLHDCNNKYILSEVGPNEIMLINIETGRRFDYNIVKVQDIYNITQQEFDSLSCFLKDYTIT